MCRFERFLLVLVVFFWCGSPALAGKVILKVFHAGSLAVPFAAIERAFEARYPHIDVRRESSGSVKAIRKVVDLGKSCDVVASADYSLIPALMFPKYADHVYLFARNELVLCYTPRSRGAEEINAQNWFEILARKGVRWGFSNPNLDPCGYRTLLMIALAEKFYGRPLWQELLAPYLPFEYRKSEGRIFIKVPPRFSPRGQKLYLRPKEVELIGLLESGALDYAVEYLSVARQHGLHYVALPPEINLGSFAHEALYRQVVVTLGTGRKITGKPIVYGIAALKVAPHPEEARLFETFVISPEGQKILEENHHLPFTPPKRIDAGL